jgi:hypothetical protein
METLTLYTHGKIQKTYPIDKSKSTYLYQAQYQRKLSEKKMNLYQWQILLEDLEIPFIIRKITHYKFIVELENIKEQLYLIYC